MTIWCILLAPIFSYVRLKAKSVIAAAILHGTLDTTAGGGLAVVLLGGNDLIIGMAGLAGFIVLLIVNICIFFFDRSYVKKPVSVLLEGAE
jgi:membrane protease YdiL (CAAX protease family)